MNLKLYFSEEKAKGRSGDTISKMAIRRGVSVPTVKAWKDGKCNSLDVAFWIEADTAGKVTAREINESQQLEVKVAA